LLKRESPEKKTKASQTTTTHGIRNEKKSLNDFFKLGKEKKKKLKKKRGQFAKKRRVLRRKKSSLTGTNT